MESPATPKTTGLAAVIARHLEAHDGLTQGDLAEAAAIAPATFSRRMRRNDWTLNEAHAIADALGVPFSTVAAELETEAA